MLIPESRAGYSRVTHPFATDQPEQAPTSPFDLHVLSTPPAFVLSQDQTLRKCLLSTSRNQLTTIRSKPPRRENLINQGYKPKTCVFNSYQINLAVGPAPTERPSTNPRQGVLALTIKHTVEFSRSGRASPVHSLLSVWREATVQTYPTRFPASTRRFQRVNPVKRAW